MPVASIYIVISLLIAFCNNTKGLIITIPDDLPTIQTGLNEVGNGDTLYIRNGTYNETLIAPPYQFIIIGEFFPDSGNSSRPLVNASELQTPDSTPVLRLPSNSRVTIENIHFKNQHRVGIVCTGFEATLNNCVVELTLSGFNFPQDSLGALVTLRDTRFLRNFDQCVRMLRGNTLYAIRCRFDGSGIVSGHATVSVAESVMDSCYFYSTAPFSLLYCYQGPHVITNCSFGPVRLGLGERVVDASGGEFRFINNELVDCIFAFRAMDVESTIGDSVVICDNRFTRCHAANGAISAQGVLSVWSQGETHRGPYICDNVFTECYSNAVVDDIMVPFEPARLERNVFIRDSMNGLPSISAGDTIGNQSAVVLRDNVWEECGYAVSLSASADARSNYWGHPSGPYHETANPNGLGDTITGPVQFIPWLTDTTTGIGESRPEFANEIELDIFPNPFNSSVTIEYALTKEQRLLLEIYDVLGRKVETLLDETQSIGVHSVLWKVEAQASGLYFARLSSPGSSLPMQAVKLLLMK